MKRWKRTVFYCAFAVGFLFFVGAGLILTEQPRPDRARYDPGFPSDSDERGRAASAKKQSDADNFVEENQKGSDLPMLEDASLMDIILARSPDLTGLVQRATIDVVRTNGLAIVTIGRDPLKGGPLPKNPDPNVVGPVFFGSSVTATIEINERSGIIERWIEGGY